MRNFMCELKFWCHKILPLVYEDSLSYYEVLCKLMKKINEIIEDMDDIKISIQEIINEIDDIWKVIAPKFGEPTRRSITDGQGNVETYYSDTFVVYNNKLYRSIRETGATTFINNDWISVNIGDELSRAYERSNRLKMSSFNTFKCVLWDDLSDEMKGQYKDLEFFNRTDPQFIYDFIISDCNHFMPNSVVTDVPYNWRNSPAENDGEMYNIITYGGGNNLKPGQLIINGLVGHQNIVQLAIPLYSGGNEPKIKWRYRNESHNPATTDNEGLYGYSAWTEIGGSQPIPQFDNLDSVIGATVFRYNSANTYNVGDYCTVENNSVVTMYRALDTTTGSFDSTKWEATNIINELSRLLLILAIPNTIFRSGVLNGFSVA